MKSKKIKDVKVIIHGLPAESLALQLARRPDRPWSAVDVCYVERIHHRKNRSLC